MQKLHGYTDTFRNFHLPAFVVILCSLCLPFIIVANEAPLNEIILETAQGKHRFQVETAKTQEQQQKGLMFRKTLPEKHGMLFIFSPARKVSMWMKNTLIPLDMIFFDAKGTVQHIHHNAKPHSHEMIMPPYDRLKMPTTYVLEINGGEAAHIGLKSGDSMQFEAMPELTTQQAPAL